jgi:hypothetical protein
LNAEQLCWGVKHLGDKGFAALHLGDRDCGLWVGDHGNVFRFCLRLYQNSTRGEFAEDFFDSKLNFDNVGIGQKLQHVVRDLMAIVFSAVVLTMDDKYTATR